MADNQLTLFDPETLPGRACHKPTKKNPNGRTGTDAGVQAHYAAKDELCEECSEFARKRTRGYNAKKRENAISKNRKKCLADPEKYADRLPIPAVVDPSLACVEPTHQYPFGRTGTSGGYHTHRKAGEAPCAPCVSAHTRKNRDYKEDHWEEYQSWAQEYYHKNAEELRRKSREYQKANKDELSKRQKIYYQENKERLASYRKEWREKNPEREAEYSRISRQRNPERERYHTLRRIARLKELPTDNHTSDCITREHGTICYLCETEVDINLPKGTPASPQIDHVIPLSNSSSPGHVISNTRWTHARCNMSKGARKVSELALPFPPPSGNTY